MRCCRVSGVDEQVPGNQAMEDTVRGWIKLASEMPGNLSPGGVFLVFGGYQRLDKAAAGLELCLRQIVGKDGKRAFRSIRQLIPESLRDTTETVRDALASELKSWEGPVDEIKKFVERDRFSFLPTGDANELLASLRKCEPSTAVIVSAAQIYRFPEIMASALAETAPLLGVTGRFFSQVQLESPHIFELARRSAQIARERSLNVVLLCETDAPPKDEWPTDIDSSKDIAVLVSYSDKLRSTTEGFLQLVQRVKAGEMPEDHFASEVSALVEQQAQRAFLTAQLLFLANEPFKAWATIEPKIEDLRNEPASNQLSAANMALSAGQEAAAESILKQAIQKGLSTVENIHFAYQIAATIGSPVAEPLYARLCAEFPNDPRVVSIQCQRAIKDGNFTAGQQFAHQLGDWFLEKLCAAFNKTPPDLAVFFDAATKKGLGDKAYLAAARAALAKGLPAMAGSYLDKIPDTSPSFTAATRLKIRLLGRSVSESGLTDKAVATLEPLMEYVALHPADIELRTEMEEFLDERLEEPAALAVLSLLIVQNAERLMKEIEQGKFSFVPAAMDKITGNFSIEETQPFFKAFLEGLPKTGVVIGRGELPSTLKSQVSNDLAYRLYQMIDVAPLNSASLSSDASFIRLLLHANILVSRELDDPGHDFLGARLAIGRLASVGAYQEARNLGETALVNLPPAQPDHLEWRVAQGWASYAEAFHRSHNVRGALRALCLSLVLQKEPLRHRHAIASLLRLTARVLRDANLDDLALKILDLERAIHVMHDEKLPLLQVDLTKISVQARNISRSTPPDKIYDLLKSSESILTQSDSAEVGPPLSCMAGIMRWLRLRNLPIPEESERKFSEELHKVSPEIKAHLLNMAAIAPTKDDLLEALKRTGAAQNWDDLSYELMPLHALATAAIAEATRNKDAGLWLLAASIASQPTLSARAADSSTSSTGALSRAAHQAIADPSFSAERVNEIMNALNAAARDRSHSVQVVGEVSVENATAVLASDESVFVLAHDPFGELQSLTIPAASEKELIPIAESGWSSNAFSKWREKYPYEYREWSPSDPTIFTLADLDLTIAGLDLVGFPTTNIITIAPPPELFAFPFGFLKGEKGFAGLAAQISVVPSMPWLIAQRASKRESTGKRVAWFGHPTRSDAVLNHLRGQVETEMQRVGIRISDAKELPELAGSDLAIVAAHGQVGVAGYFRNFGDGYSTFSPEDLGGKLENCAVAVILSCSGGKTDPRSNTMEAAGAVASLLDHGVRAVISPLWPVQAIIAQTWIIPFTRALSEGQTVGSAAAAAAAVVKQKFDHPCAWGAMTVFGDQSQTVT